MKMRLVPETATEEMATRAADKMLYPSVYMGGTPALAIKQAAGILAAGLAAAPSAGRVPREAVERVARDTRAAWVKAREGDDAPADATSIWSAVAAAAIAALGLELAPDAATARGGDGEEAGDAADA